MCILRLFAACALLVGLSSASQAALTAQFKFDEISGEPIDSTGNVVGATLIGTPTQGASPAIDGKAIYLGIPPDQFGFGVNLTGHPGVAPTNNFTVTMFVRPDQGMNSAARLVDASNTTLNLTQGAGFRIVAMNGNRFQLQLRDGASDRQAVTSPTNILGDSWYFVAGRFSSAGSLSISVIDVTRGGTVSAQNVLDASSSQASLNGAINYTLNYEFTRLGIGADGTAGAFRGTMDDVRFYDNVLDDASLASLASVPAPAPVLEINRLTGTIDLINNTAAALPIQSYSITSARGALVASSWKTVGQFYDASGNGAVDATQQWSSVISSKTAIGEQRASMSGGGSIATPSTIRLGDAGAWLANPVEDVQATLTLADGSAISSRVLFTGNQGRSITASDLNGDGTVGVADWSIFKQRLNGLPLSASLSPAELFRQGDLDGDFDVDREDFVNFKASFEAALGVGSLAVLARAVPEPASLQLILIGVVLFARRSVACRCAA